MKRRNPAARALADPLFRKRVVKAKKGRASYVRKPRSATPPSGASRFRKAATSSLRRRARRSAIADRTGHPTAAERGGSETGGLGYRRDRGARR